MSGLTALIKDHIRTHGAMNLADYMQWCLQHPEHGYYRQAQAVGASGDFITAPEISQIFGELLGLWGLEACIALAPHTPISLVELGPGRGTLMADMLRMIAKQPAISARINVHLVESNATLREQQAQKLQKLLAQQQQPTWHDTIDSLPTDTPLIIIANEFFDTLPIQQWVRTQERTVMVDKKGALAFSPAGAVTRETCPLASEILRTLASRLKAQGGAMLAIDYGYDEAKRPISAESRDTLQALKNHAFSNPLEDCGEADLTAHVDFNALREVAVAQGLIAHGTVEQGAFLQRLGGDIWLQKLMAKATDDTAKNTLADGWFRLISPAQMGSLFKVMAFSPPPKPPLRPSPLAGF